MSSPLSESSRANRLQNNTVTNYASWLNWTVSFNQKAQLFNGDFEDSYLGTHFNLSTKPLPSEKVSTILPISQEFCCEDSVATRTTSPIVKFLWGRTHVCLSSRRGRYFPLHLLQKISARYCTCFHVQLENKSSVLNRLGGKVTSDLKKFALEARHSESSEQYVYISPKCLRSETHVGGWRTTWCAFVAENCAFFFRDSNLK